MHKKLPSIPFSLHFYCRWQQNRHHSPFRTLLLRHRSRQNHHNLRILLLHRIRNLSRDYTYKIKYLHTINYLPPKDILLRKFVLNSKKNYTTVLEFCDKKSNQIQTMSCYITTPSNPYLVSGRNITPSIVESNH